MERNDDLSGTGRGGSTGGAGGATGGSTDGAAGNSNFSGSLGTSASENVGNIGATTGAGTHSSEGNAAGFSDRARDLVGTAGERLADVGSTVRDRAGTAKNSLADMLETGADRLGARQQGGMSGDGTMAMADTRMAQVNDRLASGMRSAANVLRDTDWDGIRTGIEKQVRENPGRSLLVAVGVGYLLGKALRR